MLFANSILRSLKSFKLSLLTSTILFFRTFLLVILTITITSCTGMRDAVIKLPQTPLAQDQVRIIIKRLPATKSDMDNLYSDFSARAYVNGKKVGVLAPGDVIFTDINAGLAVIKVDNRAMPGKYSLSLNVKPNTEYKFDVSARVKSKGLEKLFGIFDRNSYDKSKKNTGLFKVEKASFTKKEISPSPVKALPEKKTIIKSNPLSTPVRVFPKKKLLIQPKKVPEKVKVLPKKKSIIQSKPLKTSVKPVISPSKRRLIELKKLLDEELITQKDYDLKKRQILKGM
mgnify:CR=1 FL=1